MASDVTRSVCNECTNLKCCINFDQRYLIICCYINLSYKIDTTKKYEISYLVYILIENRPLTVLKIDYYIFAAHLILQGNETAFSTASKISYHQ